MAEPTTKRGPYVSMACRHCSKSHARCIMNGGSTFWSENNPCVRCISRGLKCEKPLPKDSAPGASASRNSTHPKSVVLRFPALGLLPLPAQSLTDWQYERCVQGGTLEAIQIFPGPAWEVFKNTLLSNVATALNLFLHCSLILPQLPALVSSEVLQQFEGATMSYFGREILHPTWETILGTILLIRYMQSRKPTCSRDLRAMLHTWWSTVNQHDGLKNIQLAFWQRVLANLAEPGPSNSYGLYSVEQQIVNNQLSTSLPTAGPIGGMPTEQISPRHSYEIGGAAQTDELSTSTPSTAQRVETLVTFRANSPSASAHSDVLSSVSAPPPYMIEPFTPAPALAAAPAGFLSPLHLNSTNFAPTRAVDTVAPSQVFPVQHSNIIHPNNMSNASTSSIFTAPERRIISQPRRKDSYAEAARRGLNSTQSARQHY
ncbi:uncharacterized protein EI90DRAFT_3064295 [Cantharellus anzutake]|uniref:uncharacterized protein n=1 Tax=Cantharellus anzutake TaxID=1750568 RepID=UPI001905A8F0|nr:uncharacterized protein EI90DRAFT_3064295 [Cantharellus anzutake]KAF8328698.1 hypothetical protein EI90DRAFT_3064295 [Cantharellus anzutake]